MSVKNYLSQQEVRKIDDILSNLLLTLHKSYPDDSLLDIVKGAIPGVQVLEYDFGPDIRGVIYKKSKEFATPRIVLRKSLSPEQKTFALGHELGHYLLDHPGKKNLMLDKMIYDGSRAQQLEAQAQYFAAALLMPEDKFIWMAKAIPDDEQLAKRFGVSQAAVRVRRNWLRTNG
jgi:Zn-dependent peptidase ImmA (M78 family)